MIFFGGIGINEDRLKDNGNLTNGNGIRCDSEVPSPEETESCYGEPAGVHSSPSPPEPVGLPQVGGDAIALVLKLRRVTRNEAIRSGIKFFGKR